MPAVSRRSSQRHISHWLQSNFIVLRLWFEVDKRFFSTVCNTTFSQSFPVIHILCRAALVYSRRRLHHRNILCFLVVVLIQFIIVSINITSCMHSIWCVHDAASTSAADAIASCSSSLRLCLDCDATALYSLSITAYRLTSRIDRRLYCLSIYALDYFGTYWWSISAGDRFYAGTLWRDVMRGDARRSRNN